MNLAEFFEQGYFYFLVTAFGLLLVLGTFILSYIRTQKLPLIQLIISGVFLLLIFIKPLLVMFGFAPTLMGVDLHFDLLVVFLSAALILADHVVYILFTNGNLSRKSLFVLAPLKTGRPIYLYLDQKGKPALVNKPLLEKLELPEDCKNLKKVAKNFEFEGNYVYGEFFKKLNLAEDGIVEFTIQLDDRDVKFQLEKMTIKETVKGEETVIGSVLVGLEGDLPEAPAEEEAPQEEEALVAPVEEEAPAEEEPQEEQPEEEPQEEEQPAEEEQPEEEPQEEQPAEEEQPEEEPQEEQPEEQPEEEKPAEEEPQEEKPAEEEPQEEAPAEEPAPEEQPEEEKKPEEAPADGEEKPEEVSMDELNKVDLDNSFLNDDEEK